MSALISFFIMPLLMFFMAISPGADDALAQQEWQGGTTPPFSYDFGHPRVDSPLWWNLPFTRPHMRRQLPQLDFARLREDLRNPEYISHLDGSDRFFRLLGNQITENDFALILLNYPRIAFTFDSELGEFRGISDEGVFHLGFNYNYRHNLFYATDNSWKRLMGYNDFYDWLSNNLPFSTFDIDTRRVHFSYDGTNYMVQLWKGRYFFNTVTGAEVGFYTRPARRRIPHYDVMPLAQSLPMAMRLTASDQRGGHVFYDLPMQTTWWINMMEHRLPRTPARYLNLYWVGDFSGSPGKGAAFLEALLEQHPEFNAEMDEDYLLRLRWGACADVEPEPEPPALPQEEPALLPEPELGPDAYDPDEE